MAQNGVTIEWIRSLTFGVAMPIWEMIRICQNFPPSGWTSAEYAFMLRPDLATKAKGIVENEDDLPAVCPSPASIHGHPLEVPENVLT